MWHPSPIWGVLVRGLLRVGGNLKLALGAWARRLKGRLRERESRECSALAKIAAHDQGFPGAVRAHGIAYVGAHGKKSALFHHAVRFFIANEVIGPNCVGFKIDSGMLDKALKGLGSVAVAPVLLSNPISNGIIVVRREIRTVFTRFKTDRPDELARITQGYGVLLRSAQDVAEDIEALLDTLMRGPSGGRPDLGAARQVIKSRRIAVEPRA